MRMLVQYYQIFCNLSLDVVAGVIAGMMPLSLCFGLKMSAAWWLGLPAATWMVYLMDHLADVYRNPELRSARHLFVWTYRKQLLTIVALLSGLCTYLLITEPQPILLLSAVTVGLFCAMYFALTFIRNPRFRFFYNKELLVSCIYATALYLPVGLSQQNIGTWLLYYLLLVGIAYLNLLMISILELETDKAQHQFSWVIVIGARRATRVFYGIVAVAGGLSMFLVLTQSGALQKLAGSYGLMVLLHAVLFRLARMTSLAYRPLSELIFWIPAWIRFS